MGSGRSHSHLRNFLVCGIFWRSKVEGIRSGRKESSPPQPLTSQAYQQLRGTKEKRLVDLWGKIQLQLSTAPAHSKSRLVVKDH